MSNDPFWEQTVQSLSPYLQQTPLTEKLLSKPPFRYLHDLISEFSRNTGFGQGLFNEEESDAFSIKDKEAKIAWLTKIIRLTELASGTSIKAKPAKIIAGLDPADTNDFLQMLSKQAKVNTVELVEKCGGQKPKAPEKEEPVQVRDEEKEEEKQPAEKPVQEEPKNKEDDAHTSSRRPKVSSPKGSSSSASPPATATASKKHDPVASPKKQTTKSKPPSKVPPQRADPVPKGKTAAPNGKKSVVTASSTSLNASGTRTVPRPETEGAVRNLASGQAEGHGAPAVTFAEDPTVTPSLPEVPALVPQAAVDSSSQPAPISAKSEHVEDMEPPSEDVRPVTFLKRPATARKPPPREKSDDTNDRVSSSTSIPTTTPSLRIVLDDAHPDEDMFVVAESLPTSTATATATTGTTMAAQGMLRQGQDEPTGMSKNDLGMLRDQIQMLTRSVHPLGKLLDYAQEDMEMMNKELEQWKKSSKEYLERWSMELETTKEKIGPLEEEVRKVEESIQLEYEKLAQVKVRVLMNEESVEQLVTQMVVAVRGN